MIVYILPLVAICGMVFSGIRARTVPPLQPRPEPIVVQLSKIDREHVLVLQRQARLVFYFETKSEPEIEAVAQEGLHKHRPLRIVDGERLIAECRVAGRAHFQTKQGLVLSQGLVLAFDSATAAEEAASAMRPRSEEEEDFDTRLRRLINDKRTWGI